MDEDWGGLDIEALKDAHRAEMAETWADEARAEHATSIRERAVANVAKAFGVSKATALLDYVFDIDAEDQALWEVLDD